MELFVSALSTRYGMVTYERGFEIVQIEGWVEEEGPWLLVCGDRDQPARRQRHTALLATRVVDIDFLVADV